VRTFSALLVMALLAIGLVACGSTSSEKTPASEAASTNEPPTSTVQVVPTLASTPGATVIATPGTSPVASPVELPAGIETGTPVVSPASSPVASPVAKVASTAAVTLAGVVVLPGTPNQDFLVTDDGCVGLGAHAGLAVGQQVVVRNESGTIVGVTQLEAGGDRVSCEWNYTVEVPASMYYEVTLPMVGEHVYSAYEVEDGPVRLELP